MSRDPSVARQLWQRLELIHAVTYFSPEALDRAFRRRVQGLLDGLLRRASRSARRRRPGGRHRAVLQLRSVAGRSGASGRVGLRPARGGARRPRQRFVAALRRSFGDDNGDATAAAAALARRAAESAAAGGTALFAANAALPWPDDPVADLWHAATLLREHRGDGHVAALTAAGVSGREANVLHSAAVGVPAEYMTVGRDYDDEEWSANAAQPGDARLAHRRRCAHGRRERVQGGARGSHRSHRAERLRRPRRRGDRRGCWKR